MPGDTSWEIALDDFTQSQAPRPRPSVRLSERPDVDGQVGTAATLNLERVWQAAERLGEDHGIETGLADEDGITRHSSRHPIAGAHPSSNWVAGEVVRAAYTADLSELSARRYDLVVSILDLGVAEEFGSLVAPPGERMVGERVGCGFPSDRSPGIRRAR
ncbi:MAG: hypothetical protein GXX94_01155 [Chloroflexi bacterium]|nr:hypothetical protein [Chloroflexota bacterium]